VFVSGAGLAQSKQAGTLSLITNRRLAARRPNASVSRGEQLNVVLNEAATRPPCADERRGSMEARDGVRAEG